MYHIISYRIVSYESQIHCWHGSLHCCECWLL